MKKIFNLKSFKLNAVRSSYNSRTSANIIMAENTFYSPQIPKGFIFYPEKCLFWNESKRVFYPQDAFIWSKTFLDHYKNSKSLTIVGDEFQYKVVERQPYNKETFLSYLRQNKDKISLPINIVNGDISPLDDTIDLFRFGMNPNLIMRVGSGREQFGSSSIWMDYHYEKDGNYGYHYIVDSISISAKTDMNQIITDINRYFNI